MPESTVTPQRAEPYGLVLQPRDVRFDWSGLPLRGGGSTELHDQVTQGTTIHANGDMPVCVSRAPEGERPVIAR